MIAFERKLRSDDEVVIEATFNTATIDAMTARLLRCGRLLRAAEDPDTMNWPGLENAQERISIEVTEEAVYPQATAGGAADDANGAAGAKAARSGVI